MEHTQEQIDLALPVYSMASIDSNPLNPYRLLVHYIKTNAYNSIEHSNISLSDFYYNYDNAARRELVESTIKKFNLPNLNVQFVDKPEHEKIFLEFKLILKKICRSKSFFVYLQYKFKISIANERLLVISVW